MVCDIVPHAADILILIRQSGVVRLLRVNLLFQQLVFGRESGTPRDADHAHIQHRVGDHAYKLGDHHENELAQ